MHWPKGMHPMRIRTLTVQCISEIPRSVSIYLMMWNQSFSGGLWATETDEVNRHYLKSLSRLRWKQHFPAAFSHSGHWPSPLRLRQLGLMTIFWSALQLCQVPRRSFLQLPWGLVDQSWDSKEAPWFTFHFYGFPSPCNTFPFSHLLAYPHGLPAFEPAVL